MKQYKEGGDASVDDLSVVMLYFVMYMMDFYEFSRPRVALLESHGLSVC